MNVNQPSGRVAVAATVLIAAALALGLVAWKSSGGSGRAVPQRALPLAPISSVGAATGHATAFFNGRHYLGKPRDIPLLAHARIQLDVGRPLFAPESIEFPPGL